MSIFLSSPTSLIPKQLKIPSTAKDPHAINELSPLEMHQLLKKRQTEKKARFSFRRPGCNVI